MKTKCHHLTIILQFMFLILVSACGNNSTSATQAAPTQEPAKAPTDLPTVTNTPDPCAPENLDEEVQKVHKYMREFDDASSLAASMPREQLSDSIANLQRIRREAEDQYTPTCLANLKTFQISHMNAVINTLIAFMGGSDQQTVNQGIALARDQHDRYTLELARLLGITVEPASPIFAPTQTPSP